MAVGSSTSNSNISKNTFYKYYCYTIRGRFSIKTTLQHYYNFIDTTTTNAATFTASLTTSTTIVTIAIACLLFFILICLLIQFPAHFTGRLFVFPALVAAVNIHSVNHFAHVAPSLIPSRQDIEDFFCNIILIFHHFAITDIAQQHWRGLNRELFTPLAWHICCFTTQPCLPNLLLLLL